jgi:transposase
MSRTSNDVRQIYLRLRQQGKGILEISKIIGVSRQSLWTWSKMTDQELMIIKNQRPQKPSIDLKEFEEYYRDNPYKFDWEVGLVFGIADSTVQKWRNRINDPAASNGVLAVFQV